MKIIAPAKINLALDVLGRDPCGYHHIKTIFHQIDELFDEIEITEPTKNGQINRLETVFEHSFADSLPAKALSIIRKKSGVKSPVKITIKKNIPFSSGLGGMSSDAAAILKGLNRLWKLRLSQEELLALAEKLGMDVPFFIIGGTALGTHFGEKIKPLKPIKEIKFTVNPASSSDQQKTANAFKSLDLSKCGKNQDKTRLLLEAIENSDNKEIIKNLHNDFETIFPVDLGVHLAGSGPSVFF